MKINSSSAKDKLPDNTLKSSAKAVSDNTKNSSLKTSDHSATGRTNQATGLLTTEEATQPSPASSHVYPNRKARSDLTIFKLDDPICNKTAGFFNAVKNSYSSAHHAYKLQKNIENDPENAKYKDLKQHLKTYKNGRDNPDHASHANGSFEAAYEAIQDGCRPVKNPSCMENLLPKDSKFRASLYPFNGTIRNVKTGLYAELRELANPDDGNAKDKIYVLCFPGTDAAGNAIQQWNNNIDQARGKKNIPPSYEAALDLATELKQAIEAQGGHLELAGHSLGGGEANYCGFMLDLPSVAFNAAPLGEGCYEKIKDKLHDQTLLSSQVHIRVKGDPVSSEKNLHGALHSAQLVTGDLKVTPPRHYGTMYILTPDQADHPDNSAHIDYPENQQRQTKFYLHSMDALRASYDSAASRKRQAKKALVADSSPITNPRSVASNTPDRQKNTGKIHQTSTIFDTEFDGQDADNKPHRSEVSDNSQGSSAISDVTVSPVKKRADKPSDNLNAPGLAGPKRDLKPLEDSSSLVEVSDDTPETSDEDDDH